ncbi:putative manganese efflux pump MntP [bioreactor metagenome]|uniref:Putative manganese efflux pump MntP n=1 Tax=bioreactor metagenome TaxID=1076179 RepID=A0A645BDE7_9ZZZZ
MDFSILLLIALSLSMDAFAVSVGMSLSQKNITKIHALKAGGCFGLFQALMPILGYLLGRGVSVYIARFDHWVAFAVLVAIGIKMIIDSSRGPDGSKNADVFGIKALLVMGVATSIDALAVGIGFALLNVNIVLSALTIGVVTFILSAMGVLAGRKFGPLFEKRASIIGGIVLIGIGLKILLEHLLG